MDQWQPGARSQSTQSSTQSEHAANSRQPCLPLACEPLGSCLWEGRSHQTHDFGEFSRWRYALGAVSFHFSAPIPRWQRTIAADPTSPSSPDHASHGGAWRDMLPGTRVILPFPNAKRRALHLPRRSIRPFVRFEALLRLVLEMEPVQAPSPNLDAPP